MNAKWVNDEYIDKEQSTPNINALKKTTAMKEEIKFLIEIADRFDNDAQDVLDFVAKNGNLEKAAKALAGAGKPTVSVTPPTITCPERSDLGKLPDGVYFIAGATEGEVNTKTYAKYDPSMTAAPFPTKRIGKQNIKAMTNILLSIIAMSLFARIVLQVRQGKRAVEKEKRTI